MTNEQQKFIVWHIRYALRKLQDIEAGNHPDAQELRHRRLLADHHLNSLLHILLPVLPNDLRADVQTCWETHERIWSTEYLDAYYAVPCSTQQETSPQCLPAQDSLSR